MSRRITDNGYTGHQEGVAHPRDLSFDYLRATLTLMVVAHHSSLAYTTFAHFDTTHYLASTAPVVDSTRWLFLDYAENFNDVFFMSLMFFISGLFVWPSLRRSGPVAFLRSRFVRLGAPFAIGVLTLMPLAYYASWQLAGRDAGYPAYWRQNITLDGWPPGPLWFIWLLLFFDIVATAAFIVSPRRASAGGASIGWMKRHPVLVAAGTLFICAVVYLPPLKVFGFGAWGALLTPPFYFQLCRIGLYLVWFLAGAWCGNDGLTVGLLAEDGALARHWPWWLAGCFIAYNALVFVPRLLVSAGYLSAFQSGILAAVLWVISCVASCFGFLAWFRGAIHARRRWMDSIARSAFTVYLVHYVYVLWIQRALMGLDVHASLKFLATFTVATGLSWLTAQGLLMVPSLRRIL